MWNIEYTEEFEAWWETLTEGEQIDITASIELLETRGPNLNHPHSSNIFGSNYAHMRELRVQHAGQPYRVLYAFDPRRTAILLIGGNKKGHDRWYKKYIPIADMLYKNHIATLEKRKKP